MSDLAKRAESHDELWAHVRQRLVEEGLSPQRAEALATALVDPESRQDALGEIEDRLDRLTDVVERLVAHVEGGADSTEPAAPSAPAPAPEDGRANSVHHPIRAVEHEAEHLRDLATKGESAKTPAIVAGG